MMQKSLLKNPVETQCESCGEIGHMPEEWLGLEKNCGQCGEKFRVTEHTEESDDA